jgi:hypothetical protein
MQRERERDKLEVTNLGNTSSEYYNFVQFAYSLHELIYTRPFYDIDIVILSFNLNGYGEISLMQYL